ncbi:hypothetical protein B4915_11490 [Leucobacter massiliensis]|uniref:Uncharacterized protein n=1 Tax=Leucobacter massiliensis TaxID=1686285 RepID=A0A2S9QLZ7_9MICO|nr:hypothetical protein B4915_11490 [Leucobacter massiliensis]
MEVCAPEVKGMPTTVLFASPENTAFTENSTGDVEGAASTTVSSCPLMLDPAGEAGTDTGSHVTPAGAVAVKVTVPAATSAGDGVTDTSYTTLSFVRTTPL